MPDTKQLDKKIRLDKALCDMGLGTRSEIKKCINKGNVWIDGNCVKDSAFKLIPHRHEIIVCGKKLLFSQLDYIMLNKPQGVISATEDSRQRTVVDLLANAGLRKDIGIVGRLDIDTEGLLLLTNDGALNHDLLSPRHHVEKVYEVVVDRDIPESTKELFQKGVAIDDTDGTFQALPAMLELIDQRHAYLTIWEGKFHQVKRMFRTVGCTVVYLKRIRMGTLVLDEGLQPGEYRRLTQEEILALKGASRKRDD